ncbi:hypothetical protein DFH07DRAFT_940633 [Mycena maculata]|uniref:Uncharacterized protein n=1 Tax=Mycena maculata TaxID=230809 RepID=A0AAD7J4E7_9AGAR|nr:hypothetical protein DFH07DRAFT_940633 [Mycena maculata]
MNYSHPSPDYLSLQDLDLRSFGSPEGPYKCWSRTLEPWHTLLAPYPPFYLDQPPSPTDTCASFASSSTTGTPPPRPQTTHVVCNAPLVAPIPLPYHSPTFLQFELPDIDEDLSHPPYTRRAAALKRKRTEDDSARPQKRRISVPVPGNMYMHAHTGPRTRSSTRALPYQLRR